MSSASSFYGGYSDEGKFKNKTCECGKKCLILISGSKNNPNRLYYSCPSGMCGGFMGWVQALEAPVRPTQQSEIAPVMVSRRSQNEASWLDPIEFRNELKEMMRKENEEVKAQFRRVGEELQEIRIRLVLSVVFSFFSVLLVLMMMLKS